MRQTKIAIANLIILGFFLAAAQSVWAQGKQVAIRVRTGDGSPLADEEIILLSSPDDEAVSPDCVTDDQGECAWNVGRGVYQVQFVNRNLDAVSALAVAEGGLSHFGITVGDEEIAYHFVLHRDGRIYFDQTPDAPLPSPIIPTLEDLHWHEAIAPEAAVTDTPAPAIISLQPEPTQTAVPGLSTPVSELAAEAPAFDKGMPQRRLLALVPIGLLLGIALHLIWKRRGKTNRPSAKLTDQGENRASRT
ncbi:MAG: hypothetical protein GY803_00910 [Chloroflexi bacterium]|nr:hypothetical protein [Chloroflexota bacterium]